jgi:enoyl-CoA hydratase
MIRYERDRGVAILTLDRPAKLNAINAAMISGLHAALDRAEADEAVQVVLLRGAGRAFSAGFDQDSGSGDAAFWRAELRRDFELIMRFWDCPKPTIAAVHGYCLGSAMEMALACDITLAARDARFGAPEVLFGSGIVCLLLPWLVGPKIAKEMLLSGNDRIDAGHALAIGLVNRVCDSERLLEDALELARTIAGNDTQAVRLTKRAINRTLDIMGLRAALEEALETDVLVESTDSPEKREFAEVMGRDGVKAALAWRRARGREQA